MGREVATHPRTFPESYWSRVDRRSDDECWLWRGQLIKGGYGRVFVGYDRAGKTVMHLAHRVAWELEHGEAIPGDLLVRHKCDNPPCQNPNHLELGTHVDNMQDRTDRGRHTPMRGSRHGKAKLTEQDVREIRELAANGTSTAGLARRFAVSEYCVYAVVNRVTWRHVEDVA